jgi:hypothetical protein
MAAKERQRAALVAAHHARVAHDVGRDDGGKAALLTGQWNFPALLQGIVEGSERLSNPMEDSQPGPNNSCVRQVNKA